MKLFSQNPSLGFASPHKEYSKRNKGTASVPKAILGMGLSCLRPKGFSLKNFWKENQIWQLHTVKSLLFKTRKNEGIYCVLSCFSRPSKLWRPAPRLGGCKGPGYAWQALRENRLLFSPKLWWLVKSFKVSFTSKFGVICALIWSTQSPSTSYIPSEKKLKTVFAESVRAKLLQSCPTLCDPVDCSPPGCSVQGTLQARILEWVATPFARGPSRPRDRTRISLSLLPW